MSGNYNMNYFPFSDCCMASIQKAFISHRFYQKSERSLFSYLSLAEAAVTAMRQALLTKATEYRVHTGSY